MNNLLTRRHIIVTLEVTEVKTITYSIRLDCVTGIYVISMDSRVTLETGDYPKVKPATSANLERILREHLRLHQDYLRSLVHGI